MTALEKIKQLETLVAQQKSQLDDLSKELQVPDAESDKLKTELVNLTTKHDELTKKVDELTKERDALNSKVTDLSAKQEDFDKKVQDEAKRLFASAGSQPVKSEPENKQSAFTIESKLQKK